MTMQSGVGQEALTEEQILGMGMPQEEPETPEGEAPAPEAEKQTETPPAWVQEVLARQQNTERQLQYFNRKIDHLERAGQAIPPEMIEGVKTLVQKAETDRMALMDSDELAEYHRQKAEKLAQELEVTKQQQAAPRQMSETELQDAVTNYFWNGKMPVLEQEATTTYGFTLTDTQKAELEQVPIYRFQNGQLNWEKYNVDLSAKFFSMIPDESGDETPPTPAEKAGKALGSTTKPSGLPAAKQVSIFNRGEYDITEELAKIGM